MQGDCTKCGGEMVAGFVLDKSYGTAEVITWQEGQPRKTFWQGLTKQAGNAEYEITTWRCGACGYLESYAG